MLNKIKVLNQSTFVKRLKGVTKYTKVTCMPA